MQNNMWRKGLVLGIIVLFVGASIVPGISGTIKNLNELNLRKSIATLDRGILYVGGDGPGNYSKIQEAIDNASKGDTIFVFNGTYYENVDVNKHINLIGEDKTNTIIDAEGAYYAIQILVSDVCFTNFTITNATSLFWPDPWETGALRVYQSYNVTIKNNIIMNNFIGICVYKSNGCILRNNAMYGCNIALWGPTIDSYLHDIDSSNLANGMPIYYYKNCKGITISGYAGEVFLINCTNCTISNIELIDVTNGMQVCYSKDVLIENNTITDIQSTAIHFDHSNHNTVRNNVLLRHKHLDFIFLDYSKYNTFENNIINGNAAAITLMRNSNYNRVFKNDLSSKNIQSMIIDSSNWNQIICNNINGSFIKKILKKGPGDVLLSRRAFFNKFDQNYWREWAGNKCNLFNNLPKMIIGVWSAIIEPQIFPVFLDFDWHPAQEPYDI